MQVYKDGRIAHYKEMFPNVSFPSTGPSDEYLAEQNAYKVNVFKPHDRDTEKLVASDPYIEDGWAYTVRIEPLTQAEIQAKRDSLAAQVRSQRNALLASTDWTQVDDSPVDKAAWATYRQALRDITSQAGFPTQVEWPHDPNWVEPEGGV